MFQRNIKYFAYTWSIVVLIIVFLPGNQIPKHSNWLDDLQIDKVVHLFLFFPLSLLWLLRFYFNETLNKHIYFNILFFTLLFSAITEIIQYYFITGRNGSIIDGIADVIGLLIGFYLFKILKNRIT